MVIKTYKSCRKLLFSTYVIMTALQLPIYYLHIKFEWQRHNWSQVLSQALLFKWKRGLPSWTMKDFIRAPFCHPYHRTRLFLFFSPNATLTIYSSLRVPTPQGKQGKWWRLLKAINPTGVVLETVDGRSP